MIRIVHVLKIKRMTLFCKLFMERPSYMLDADRAESYFIARLTYVLLHLMGGA